MRLQFKVFTSLLVKWGVNRGLIPIVIVIVIVIVIGCHFLPLFFCSSD